MVNYSGGPFKNGVQLYMSTEHTEHNLICANGTSATGEGKQCSLPTPPPPEVGGANLQVESDWAQWSVQQQREGLEGKRTQYQVGA